MTKNATFLLGGFISIAGGVSPALAQGVQDGHSASTDNRSSDRALEEIIVTATKREERMQDVPLSITAIGAADIERRNLRDAEDYLRGIPGATQSGYSQGQTIIIRGLESATRDQNFSSGPVVATYFGETPTTNTGGIQGGSNVDIKLVDIERVEVLRGPQGTAFGNASLGGAVRVIPAAPDPSELTGKVSAGYSQTAREGGDNYELEGVFNVPISQTVAFRAVAYGTRDSGHYRNVAGSDPTFQSAVVMPLGAQAIAADDEEVGTRTVTGFRAALLTELSDAARLTLSYLDQESERNGVGITNLGNYRQALLQVAPGHVYRGREEGVIDGRIQIANALLEYDLGWANLLATYSYSYTTTLQAVPFDAVGPGWPAVSYDSKGPHREHVGEVRLATDLDGAWNGLIGVYYEDQKDALNTSYLWAANPSNNFLDPTGFFDPARQRLGDRYDERNLRQDAVFGELTWNFAPAFFLTGGGRLYRYERDFIIDAEGAFYPAGLHERGDTRVTDSNFKANLSYKPNDDVHVYAGWAQGFRLGRPQGGLPPGPCDLNGDGLNDDDGTPLSSTTTLDPDSVDSYEIGAKFALFERRLRVDAAVFQIDWSGIPLRLSGNANGTNAQCRFTYNANVGDAESQGVELQATWQLAPALQLDVGGSYIHAEIVRSESTAARKGQRLPGSPEWNANVGVQYDFPIGDMDGFVRLDGIYVGSFYDDLAQTPAGHAGNYTKFDATVRLTRGSLYLDVYARNLTNEDAFVGRQAAAVANYGYLMRPRTIGLRLGHEF